MRAALVLPLVALLAALSGCAADGAASTGGRVEVVAAFYPLEFVAERVGGTHVDVTTLTHPGQEPHDLELTVRQTGELSQAGVAVYLRGLQPAVDEAVDENGPGHVVDAMAASDRRAGPDGEPDPHVWLSPANLVRVATAVHDELAAVDPDHERAYDRGLAALRRDLVAVGAEYRTGLRHCALDTVVVSHDAFRYLPTPFDFHAIAGLSPDAEPSPDHLAELAALATERQVTTVFTETLADPALADTLAAELGLRTGVLDPVEGLTDETAGEDYLSLMRANLAALRTANGCR